MTWASRAVHIVGRNVHFNIMAIIHHNFSCNCKFASHLRNGDARMCRLKWIYLISRFARGNYVEKSLCIHGEHQTSRSSESSGANFGLIDISILVAHVVVLKKFTEMIEARIFRRSRMFAQCISQVLRRTHFSYALRADNMVYQMELDNYMKFIYFFEQQRVKATHTYENEIKTRCGYVYDVVVWLCCIRMKKKSCRIENDL